MSCLTVKSWQSVWSERSLGALGISTGGAEGKWPYLHYLFHLFPLVWFPDLLSSPSISVTGRKLPQKTSGGFGSGLDMELVKGLFSTGRCSFNPPAPAHPMHMHAADTVHDLLDTHTRTHSVHTTRGKQPFSTPLMSHRCLAATRGYRVAGGGSTRRAESSSVSSNVPFLRTATSPELFKGRSVVYHISANQLQ